MCQLHCAAFPGGRVDIINGISRESSRNSRIVCIGFICISLYLELNTENFDEERFLFKYCITGDRVVLIKIN